MLNVKNRLLNEISLYMKHLGYGAVAEPTIDPIIAKTAEAGKEMAEIWDDEIISNVEFFIKKLTKDAEYRMARHLVRIKQDGD